MSSDHEPVVLLTGASGGIGRHLTRCCLKRGYRVVATDVTAETLATLQAESGIAPQQLVVETFDVRDAQAWQAVIERVITRFGSLDMLLNVAGILRPGYVHELTATEIDQHLDINAKGLMYGTQTAARVMVRQQRGAIVNIASMAALAPIPGIALYSASKFAVRAFSLAAAFELAPHNVHLSVVCPDAVATPMLDLQLDYPEAALTFSGPRSLTVEDVEWAVFERALKRRQLEVILPRRRGWLAKFSNLYPRLSQRMLSGLSAKGLKQQAVARTRRDHGL